jgi:uncharacterized protein YwqG
MNIVDLIKEVEASKIAKNKEFIIRRVRPAVDIIKKDNATSFLACSRFGGMPDLPVGTKWPVYEDDDGNPIPYQFLGQINFADIQPTNNGLPTSGLLCLFVAEGKFWQDDGYINAIYISDLTNLETAKLPSIPNECKFDGELTPLSYYFRSNKKTFVLEFTPTLDMPQDEYQVDDFPPFKYGEEDYNNYQNIRNSLHSDKYLLGYPTHCSLAYDPTPGPEWICFLCVDSDNDFEWCWHDGDRLFVFIEKEKLKELDFKNLKSDAG